MGISDDRRAADNSPQGSLRPRRPLINCLIESRRHKVLETPHRVTIANPAGRPPRTHRPGGRGRFALPGSKWREARWLLRDSALTKWGTVSAPASSIVNLRRDDQRSAREGACRKRPKRADHDSFAEPITARTYGARSCGMGALRSEDGSTGSARAVEELAGTMRAPGAVARSPMARCGCRCRCSLDRGQR